MIKKLICASALIFSTSAMAVEVRFKAIEITETNSCQNITNKKIDCDLRIDINAEGIETMDINEFEKINSIIQRANPQTKCQFYQIYSISYNHRRGGANPERELLRGEIGGNNLNLTLNALNGAKDKVLNVAVKMPQAQRSSAQNYMN